VFCVYGYGYGVNPMHVLGHPEGSSYQEIKNTCLDGFDNVTYQTVKYRLGEHFQ